MNIGQFNARGPHNGVEHWFDLIHDELINQGHEVRQFWLRGDQPTKEDKEWMDFALFHFSQVALHYMRLGVPYCILPSANDCFPDNGAKLKKAASHKNCKFVTYQSQYHLEKYKEWNIPKPKVYVPMPARIDLFKRTKPVGTKIIAGGRLIPKKGLDKLPNRSDLYIFGDGPLRTRLVCRLPKVNFVGWLEGEELRDLMEDSWLFLNPSIETEDGDKEGIPNTLKEALLMELHVISSPIAGIPELKHVNLVKDWSDIYINGYIKDLEKINQGYTFYKFRGNLEGKEEIRNIYSPENCVNKLLEMIK